MSWGALADLRLRVEEVELQGLELETRSGWSRRSTIVCLRGEGLEGLGEDVTYAAEEQRIFQRTGGGVLGALRGDRSLAAFTDHVGSMDLFPTAPAQEASREYRRWALESAGLDLALRQAGMTVQDALQRRPSSVRYVASLGLGDPPATEKLQRLRERFPGLGFKLDWSESWNCDVLDELSVLGGVAVVDFKGHYHGSFEGPPPSPDGYRSVAEALPDALLEDPVAEGSAWEALAPFAGRIAWDAPVHALEDLHRLPRPGHLNIKPSRFGSVRQLLRVLAWCESEGIPTYGGGQFELGTGRVQVQQLAALFHPDAPNDVSPAWFHGDPATDVTEPVPSPLPWPPPGRGFPA